MIYEQSSTFRNKTGRFGLFKCFEMEIFCLCVWKKETYHHPLLLYFHSVSQLEYIYMIHSLKNCDWSFRAPQFILCLKQVVLPPALEDLHLESSF